MEFNVLCIVNPIYNGAKGKNICSLSPPVPLHQTRRNVVSLWRAGPFTSVYNLCRGYDDN